MEKERVPVENVDDLVKVLDADVQAPGNVNVKRELWKVEKERVPVENVDDLVNKTT